MDGISFRKNGGDRFLEKKDGVTSTRLEDAIPRRRGAARRVSSVRSVFRARIVFDFRPIKVDSAHRPVFRGADTPGGLLSAGWIRTFGSRDRAQYPVPDLSRGLRLRLSPPRLREILFKCFLAYK